MVDRIRPLKLEDTTSGSDLNFVPTETDPTQDYVAAKGIAFEGTETALVWSDSGQMKFKDSDLTSTRTLIDAMEKIKYKTVDLTNTTTGFVITYNVGGNFELQPPGALLASLVQSANFTKQGNLAVGGYLSLGNITGSNVGFPIRGQAKIVGIYVTCSANAGSNSVIQVRRRTAVGTTSDVTGATVTLPSGQYKAKNDPISITLNTDDEILCYLKSGATLNTVSVNVFLVPVS